MEQETYNKNQIGAPKAPYDTEHSPLCACWFHDSKLPRRGGIYHLLLYGFIDLGTQCLYDHDSAGVPKRKYVTERLRRKWGVVENLPCAWMPA
jgi:hypothetical protein